MVDRPLVFVKIIFAWWFVRAVTAFVGFKIIMDERVSVSRAFVVGGVGADVAGVLFLLFVGPDVIPHFFGVFRLEFADATGPRFGFRTDERHLGIDPFVFGASRRRFSGLFVVFFAGPFARTRGLAHGGAHPVREAAFVVGDLLHAVFAFFLRFLNFRQRDLNVGLFARDFGSFGVDRVVCGF